MRSAQIIASLALLLLLWPAVGEGTTWRVEQDGSGDFTVIQDAVDAAEPGDTILVGPGLYDEVRPIPFWSEWNAVVTTDKDGLVIQGAGADQTLIGVGFIDWNHRSIAAIYVESLTLRDLTIIGGYDGVYWGHGNGLHVERCTIRNGRFGISLFTSDDITIKDSEFRDIEHTGVIANGSLSRNLLVENCVFHGETGVSIQSTSNAVVRDCEMFGMKLGVQFSLWTSGEVVRLHATGPPGYAWGGGVSVTTVSHMTMTDCVVDFSMTATGAVSVSNHATLSGQGNVLRGGLLPGVNSDMSTMYLGGPNSVENFHGNEIYRANMYCVYARYSSGDMMQPPIHLDMTNNYWGTDDADLIAEWIYDHHDRPHSPSYRAIVDYIPFASGPVPVLQRTLSEVKGMFRD